MSVSTPGATAEEGAKTNTQAKMTATEQTSKDSKYPVSFTK